MKGRIRPGRRGLRLEDSVDVIAFEGADWIYLAQDRVHCGHGNEPSGSRICSKFLSGF